MPRTSRVPSASAQPVEGVRGQPGPGQGLGQLHESGGEFAEIVEQYAVIQRCGQCRAGIQRGGQSDAVGQVGAALHDHGNPACPGAAQEVRDGRWEFLFCDRVEGGVGREGCPTRPCVAVDGVDCMK